MQYILFVFTTRKDAYRLYDYLLTEGVPAKIVNVPRELSASCGIAVRTTERGYRTATWAARNLRSLIRGYLVYEDRSGQHFRPI